MALFCFTVFYGETENPSFQEPEELGVIYGQGLGVPADIKKSSFRQMDEKIKVKI